MMSDEKKTLGQVRSEAFNTTFAETQCWTEAEAAGIAAVCRAVIDDQIAKHEKECHRLRPPTVKCDDDVAANLSSGSRTLNTGPIIACDVTAEAASESGEDFAKVAGLRIFQNCDGSGRLMINLAECAAIIREAAERHYAVALKRDADIADKAIRDRDIATKERDAALAECERLRAASPSPIDLEKFRKHLHETYSGGHHTDGHYDAFHHGMDTVCNVLVSGHSVYRQSLVAPQPAAPPSPAADATGMDELMAACETVSNRIHNAGCWSVEFIGGVVKERIRPLFDAVRAERDKWFKQHDALEDKWNSFYRRVGGYLLKLKTAFGLTDGLDDEAIVDAAIAERDKLAAELQELQEAVIASPPMSLRHTTTGTPYWTYTGAELTHPNKLSAILAAFQATKGKEQGDGK